VSGAPRGRLRLTVTRRWFEIWNRGDLDAKEAWAGEDVAVLREVSRSGGEVVAQMDWQVRGRSSGIDTHLEITNINTIEGGRIVRQRHYLDHAEALAQLEAAERSRPRR
jgi:hypothetical protein